MIHNILKLITQNFFRQVFAILRWSIFQLVVGYNMIVSVTENAFDVITYLCKRCQNASVHSSSDEPKFDLTLVDICLANTLQTSCKSLNPL